MSDTLRERCIEAGRDAMGRSSSWRWWAPRHLEKLFDLWEPMIRGHADATHSCAEAIERARADERDRLAQKYGRGFLILFSHCRCAQGMTYPGCPVHAENWEQWVRDDERARTRGIIEEADNHEEALEAALREERARSTALRAELDRAQEHGDDLDDLVARVEKLPHGDWVDPNGRPRPCPMEWPGGPCQCYRAKVIAMIRGDEDA